MLNAADKEWDSGVVRLLRKDLLTLVRSRRPLVARARYSVRN